MKTRQLLQRRQPNIPCHARYQRPHVEIRVLFDVVEAAGYARAERAFYGFGARLREHVADVGGPVVGVEGGGAAVVVEDYGAAGGGAADPGVGWGVPAFGHRGGIGGAEGEGGGGAAEEGMVVVIVVYYETGRRNVQGCCWCCYC